MKTAHSSLLHFEMYSPRDLTWPLDSSSSIICDNQGQESQKTVGKGLPFLTGSQTVTWGKPNLHLRETPLTRLLSKFLAPA